MTEFYRDKSHEQLPHVVKFSGGRSSGMMLFKLLEKGILRADRGDVIVFNNTSAEHPATYEFARKCKEYVEANYDIPFFWLEFQTYEGRVEKDSNNYIRKRAYRMVLPTPYDASDAWHGDKGYHWKGEVFEEVLSYNVFVPNVFSRNCTTSMKLDTTRAFLKDWFHPAPITPVLGHDGNCSRVTDETTIANYKGNVPHDIILEKRKYLNDKNYRREIQMFEGFSCNAKDKLKTWDKDGYIAKYWKSGKNIAFGETKLQYVSIVGIRHDEQKRVERLSDCRINDKTTNKYKGEVVYLPLNIWGYGKEDVMNFWNAQEFDLELDDADNLSNCTFCFLKGKRLPQIKRVMDKTMTPEMKDTPSDIKWWIKMENTYRRDLAREDNKQGKKDFIGFFTDGQATYETIGETTDSVDNMYDFGSYLNKTPDCDCTD